MINPPLAPKTLEEQKTDFTSEGAPPPGTAGTPAAIPAHSGADSRQESGTHAMPGSPPGSQTPAAAPAQERTMPEYRHHVSGFFAQREHAEGAFAKLIECGIPRERLHIMNADAAAPEPAPRAGNAAVLKEMLVDGALGTAIGTGIGGLAQLALVAANVSLFVASPLIAPLAMLGWGASLGGLVGAAVGAETKEGGITALIGDAISSGQVVLLAGTRTAQETTIACEVIRASVGDYEDVSTV